MARGRMLSKSFSTSAKRHALYTACPKMAEWAEFLFVMLLAHADDHGRLPGDEFTVKMQVDPISPRKLADFVAALHLLHEAGLITWYQVDERKVIEIVKFSDHQDLKGHDKRPPKLPPCPGPDALIGRSRRTLERAENSTWGPLGESGDSSKEKRSELKGREGNLTQAGEGRFGIFWLAYPKKVGKDAARKAFEKRAVSDDLLAGMLEAIERQKQSRDWLKDGGQYIPHPASWLNGARWEDEAVQAGPLKSPLTAQLEQANQDFDRLVKS